MGDLMLGRAMPTRQPSFPDTVIPPGLTDATMTDLVLRLPHGRGVVRLAGYYQLGWDLIVVYDVLDEHDTRVSDFGLTFPPDDPPVPPSNPAGAPRAGQRPPNVPFGRCRYDPRCGTIQTVPLDVPVARHARVLPDPAGVRGTPSRTEPSVPSPRNGRGRSRCA
jgi:hypothetical protein